MSEMMLKYRRVSFISIGHGSDHMTSIVLGTCLTFPPN